MKKLLSIVISICICVGISASAYAVDYGEELKNAPTKTYEQEFSDVPQSYWAFSYIAEMSERGVLSGYEDGTFQPDKPVTRAEAAKMLASIAGQYTDSYYEEYIDVYENDWFRPYVLAMSKNFNNYEVNVKEGKHTYRKYQFRPNDNIQRSDVVVALIKQLYNEGTLLYDIPDEPSDEMFAEYIDFWEMEEKKQPYFEVAIKEGIISGYQIGEDMLLVPYAHLTRAEMATILFKAYECIDYSNIIINNPLYMVNRTLDEFIIRYNSAIEENFSKLSMLEDYELGAKRFRINKDLLTSAKAEDYLTNGEFDDFTAYANMFGNVFVCDENDYIRAISAKYTDDSSDKYFTDKRFRNRLSYTKYRDICVIMALFNVSFDKATEVLNAVIYNNNFEIYNNFTISLYKNELSITDMSVNSGIDIGKMIITSNSDLPSFDIEIDEFINKYNDIVCENFKKFVNDTNYDRRRICPNDYMLSTNSMFGTTLQFGEEKVIGYKLGEITICCDNQNEILYIKTPIQKNFWGSIDKTKLSTNDFAAICMMMAIEDISYDEAVEYFLITSKDDTYASENSVYLISSSGYEIDIASQKFYKNFEDNLS